MTQRLQIEPMALGHAESLFRALDFDSVYEFIPPPRPANPKQVSDRIERVLAGPGPASSDLWLNFVVSLAGEIIGRLEATALNTWAEIAYLFNPKASGKGYATEGVHWLIDHMRQTYGITEFWATTDPRNLKSSNLLLRCGFQASSLPEHGLHSYSEGDAVFALRFHSDISDNMPP